MRLYIEVHVLNDDGGAHAETLTIDDCDPGDDTAVIAGDHVTEMVAELMTHRPHGADAFVGYGRPDRDWLN